MSPLTLTPLSSLPKRAVLRSTCRVFMRSAVLLLTPLPAVWMTRGKKAVPLQKSPGTITVTLMKTTQKVREDLAAGQLHEALTDKPTKCDAQVVFPYNQSTGFN